MAYSVLTPPQILVQGIGNGAPSIWTYASADTLASIVTAGYITNGGQLGMRVNDLVIISVTAGTIAISSSRVQSVSTTAPGAVNLSSGTTIGTT